jgi:hypothetical protein
MSEARNSDTSTLDAQLSKFHEMERAAQSALLHDAQFLYMSAPPIDQPKRIAEIDDGQPYHKVYKVSITGVQKYLDDIGEIIEKHSQLFSLISYPPPFEADLRSFEVCSSFNVAQEENIPYEIVARCPINFSHSKFKAPIKLVILGGATSINFSNTTFERYVEVNVKNGPRLDMVVDGAAFDDVFVLNGDRKTSHTAFAISANTSRIKSFMGIDAIFSMALFQGAKFADKALFQNCQFMLSAKFINSQFSAGALFFGCSFLKAPDFHGVDLHQDTAFQKCNFDVSTSVIDDVASFRVLKAHFAKMRDSKHELMFHALEQRTERLTSENDLLVSFISRLYDEISEYGASIGRTVKFFFLWNIIFLLIFHFAATLDNGRLIEVKNETLNAYPPLFLALQNAFNPLALFSEKQLVSVNSIAVYTASLFQSLGSIVILALMLLAIRGRFRKGSGSDN